MQFAPAKVASRQSAVLPLIGAALIPAVLVLVLTCMSMNHAEEVARLPASPARPPAMRESPVISVRLARNGAVTIAGQAVSSDALAAAWQRERAAVRMLGFEPSRATIVLRADPDVPTEVVQRLIEQAQQAGFQRCVLREAEEQGHEVHK
jgi:biopolymer transport protein ExbD